MSTAVMLAPLYDACRPLRRREYNELTERPAMTSSRVVPAKFISSLLSVAVAALTIQCGGDGSGITPPTEPSIGLSSASVSFTATAGGAPPAPQAIEITNGGAGTLDGLSTSISYTAGQPTDWLTSTLSATAAPSTLILTVEPGSLTAATYTANIAVTSAGASNSPQTVAVTLTVTPSAGGGMLIALSSTSQTFTGPQGGANPAPQTLEVTNGGDGTLDGLATAVTYTAGQPTGWLAASLSSTEAPSTLTLDATTGGLTAGTYSASVAVTSPVASNSPQTVNVTFTVAPPAGAGPLIALSSTNRSFTAPEGGANPAAQTVGVTNSGGGTLSGLAASVSYTASQPTGWLTANLSSAVAPSTLTLTASTGSLAAGTYTASVAVTSPVASNSPQTVNVTFTVAPPAGGGPLIALSSTNRSFTAPEGGANPAAQTVRVTNSGGGTLSGLAASVSYTASQPTGWLAASLSSTEAPSTLTLAATTGSLTAGTYSASVAVTSPAASNSPQTVNVTFTVAPSAGSPSITLSPSNVTLSASEGGADPADQTVDVTNGGTGTLSGLAVGTVTYGAGATGWLAATLSVPTAPATLTLGATTGSLGAGTYTATVPITSSLPGVSSQNVNVSFVVRSTSTAAGIFAASLVAGSAAAAGPSDLYVVEPSATGSDLLRGRIETASHDQPVITDLALSPDGTLYGISFTTLYKITPSTGAAEVVGSLGLSDANALAFDGNGKLFGARGAGSLFEVRDLATGVATDLGSFGVGLQSGGDIVFAADGTLFGAAVQGGDGVLVTIDPATGTATPVASGTSIGFDNVWGLSYFGGELYGLTSDPGIAQGELIKIDVSLGTATRVRSLSFDTGGAGVRRP